MAQAEPQLIIDFPGAPRRRFARPTAELRAERLSAVRDVLDAAEHAAREGCYVAGFITYEAAPAFEPAMRVVAGARMPLAWFAVFDAADPAPPAASAAVAAPAFVSSEGHDDYAAKVERIRSEIASGRTYQVNLTTRLEASCDGELFALYERLRRAQGAGYHAYLDTGDFVVISASPELFFQTRDRRIRTRPMKGTRARGRWEEEDRAIVAALAASEKDRAENLMIVDLLRNDLGRVASVGSVEVTALFEIERYRTVHQMTSTIEAELRAGVGLVDVFGALFPCGSVTGAPKISTMGLIAELEESPREVYCGAMGVIEPGGDATFNVPIRTIWVDRALGRASYGSGAGITYDSDAAAEYAEVEAKAALLAEHWPEFELLETMRAQHGCIVRLDRHVARVLASARYFDVPADEQSIRKELERAAGAGGAPRVVRLLVDQAGGVRSETRPLEPVGVARGELAREPVSSHDRFLYHKTTHRCVYDDRLARQPGCWDVLLFNERGEVTEFTRGNVVVELNGDLLTPARDCGLLAGTFRAELLEHGRIAEAVVRVDELAAATHIWLINSVREWLETDFQNALNPGSSG